MKCANCGFEIPKGKVYCPECGAEVQLVPDFTTVSMERQQLLKEQAELEKQMRREEASRQGRTRPGIAFLMALLTVLIASGIAFLMIFYIYQHAMSNYGYLRTHAEQEFRNRNYALALTFCDRALDVRPDSISTGIFKAGILMKMQNSKGAENELRRVYEENPDCEEACRELIRILLSEEQYEDVAEIVNHCPFPDIMDAYGDYLTGTPVFSLAGGETYPAGTTLKITCSTGKIYYTTDGKNPGKDSTPYTKPVKLKKGVNRIHAVSINSYGVESEVAKMICTIE